MTTVEDTTETDDGLAPSDVDPESHPGARESDAPLDLDVVAMELAEVTAALERLDAGGYGRCGTCGGAIDDETLGLSPAARSCAAHLWA